MKNKPVILFDGICNFCNSWVNFIIRNDKKKFFLFASLQSDAGKKILKEMKVVQISPETVVLIYNGKYFFRSDVALETAKILGGKWLAVFFILKIIPKFLRDVMYNFIAKNRYKWFGRRETCMIPDESVKERFLFSSDKNYFFFFLLYSLAGSLAI